MTLGAEGQGGDDLGAIRLIVDVISATIEPIRQLSVLLDLQFACYETLSHMNVVIVGALLVFRGNNFLV